MPPKSTTAADIAPGAKGGKVRAIRLFSKFQAIDLVVFLVLLAIFAALIIPPVVSLFDTALTDPDSGRFSLKNFTSILPILIRAKLLYNTLFYAIATTLIAFVFGSVLAWLSERTDAPFRRVLYVCAFLSFALPGVVKVLGWIFLFGRRQGLINDLLVNRIGILSQPFDIQSMGGMIWVEIHHVVGGCVSSDGRPLQIDGCELWRRPGASPGRRGQRFFCASHCDWRCPQDWRSC